VNEAKRSSKGRRNSLDRLGEEGTTESLTADRSEVEVMIDHFCRRLAGGLIPVADISDVCRCLRLRACRQGKSFEARAPSS